MAIDSDSLTAGRSIRVTVNGPARRDPAACRSLGAVVTVITFKHGTRRIRILDEKGRLTWVTLSQDGAGELAQLLAHKAPGRAEVAP